MFTITTDTKRTYYLNPIIKNVGSNMVTFTFPPGNGNVIPIQPSGIVYIPTTKEAITPPKNMELVFQEGVGVSYRTVLEWRLTAANVTINVGNGDAVIVTPGTITTTTKAPLTTTTQASTFNPAVGPKTTASTTTFDPAVGPITTKTPTTFDPAVGPMTTKTPTTIDPAVGPITTKTPATFDPAVGTTFDPAVGPVTKTTTTAAPKTTTIDPAVGPTNTVKDYYFNPTFINSGSTEISFTIKFANNPSGKLPVNGRTSFGINQTTANPPSAIDVQFTESGNPFGINLPWSESPAIVYVQVGSGVAKIVTDGSQTMITPAPQSLKTYYLKTSITNVGPVDVNFYLNSTEDKTGQVPSTSTATIGQTMQSSTSPPPSEIMFFEGSKSYSVPLKWSDSEAESSAMNTINVGNGKAVVVPGGGSGGSSSTTSTTTNTSGGTSGGASGGSSSSSSSTGEAKIYSIQPIVQNSGTKEVTFKFPPGVCLLYTSPSPRDS